MKLYDRALDIYKKLGDKRGVAMILLSKAEAGRPPGRVFDNELTAVEAAESFRELGNRDLFGEAVGQARSEEWQEPCTVQYTQRRRRIRSLYLSVAADQRQRTDWPAWQTTMAECIGVDLRIADQSLALADLHAILADLQTSDDNLKGELFGCYVAECGMRHETVDAAIQRDYAGLLNSTSFRHGRHSTLREVARCLVAAGDADRI